MLIYGEAHLRAVLRPTPGTITLIGRISPGGSGRPIMTGRSSYRWTRRRQRAAIAAHHLLAVPVQLLDSRPL
jgi:hypothetical protein